MTTLGIQWLQHKEQERANKMREAQTGQQMALTKSIADADRSSRESIASADRLSRESIGNLDRLSREGIASADRLSRESIAQADRESKESIATADRNSRESIAANQLEVEQQINDARLAMQSAIAELDRQLKDKIATEDRRGRLEVEQLRGQIQEYLWQLDELPQNVKSDLAIMSRDERTDWQKFIDGVYAVIENVGKLGKNFSWFTSGNK